MYKDVYHKMKVVAMQEIILRYPLNSFISLSVHFQKDLLFSLEVCRQHFIFDCQCYQSLVLSESTVIG